MTQTHMSKFDEDAPRREKTARYSQFGWEAKEHFSREYQCADRWLESQVGSRWSTVYSKATKKGLKFKEQVKWRVDENVHYEDNTAYDSQNCPVRGFYICPISGKLMQATPSKSWKREKAERKLWYKNNLVVVDDKVGYFRLDGVWTKVLFAPFVYKERYVQRNMYGTGRHYFFKVELDSAFDIVVGRDIVEREALKLYGHAVYAKEFRKLKPKKIERLILDGVLPEDGDEATL